MHSSRKSNVKNLLILPLWYDKPILKNILFDKDLFLICEWDKTFQFISPTTYATYTPNWKTGLFATNFSASDLTTKVVNTLTNISAMLFRTIPIFGSFQKRISKHKNSYPCPNNKKDINISNSVGPRRGPDKDIHQIIAKYYTQLLQLDDCFNKRINVPSDQATFGKRRGITLSEVIKVKRMLTKKLVISMKDKNTSQLR